ncbi:CHAD domain-containing protein [Pseudomonas sp. DSP3-2-2]|uniref:CHAD domain-containing protein n=1 Tax=unclassified Pseudomonas TaxID=196821 RepID=UPI003CF5B70F
MSFVDEYVRQIIGLEVTLYHARARMEANSDPEALHDLRIAVRRIRSLLRPLRTRDEVIPLNTAAANVGRVTTAARDLEVMIGELQSHGYLREADKRQAILKDGYSSILKSTALDTLFTELDNWPSAFRCAEVNGELISVKTEISKALNKRIKRLVAGLADPGHDRHDIRIMVKNTRYLTEAFPHVSPLRKKSRVELKAVQSALGSWHDHFQWCLKAKTETDLMPLSEEWTAASEASLAQAESKLVSLRHHLEQDLAK